MRYAQRTRVSEGRSRDEIERLLARYGASAFGFWTGPGQVMIQFVKGELRIQLTIPIPQQTDAAFALTAQGRPRAKAAALKAWEQEKRRRWRSLCAVVKALLIAVDEGVLTFEEAFLAHIVWHNGKTTGRILLPHIQKAIKAGQMPGSMKMLEVLDA